MITTPAPVFPSQDVTRLREDTPGTIERLHLNNAGAALMPTPVVDAVVGHIRREAAIGGYEAHAEAANRVEAVYDSVAALIGAPPETIALADSATLAWQRVFYSLPIQPGDRLLTGRAEFAANYVAYLQVARRRGVTVQIVPDDPDGALDVDVLEAMLDDPCAPIALVALTWVPTNGGLINPAAKVGALTRARGITYLLDACQAVGQLHIDVDDLGCDVLTATGRKFLRAPRGTGFAYVSPALLSTLEPAFLDLFGAPWSPTDGYQLRPDARRFETWENNYAARLGLGVAADYALSLGTERIEAHNRVLTTHLRQALTGVPGITLYDKGTQTAAIVTLTHDQFNAQELKAGLAEHAINVSVSPPTSTPLDATERALPDLLRISPHYYNTIDELDRFVRILTQLVVRCGSS